MRVLFLTNIPSPYRVDFFGELGKLVDLTVLYELEAGKDRDSKWRTEENLTYRSVQLKHWFQKTDSAFCPEVILWLKAFSNDKIIIGGYSTPTGMLAIEYLRMKKIPFILNCDGGMIKNDSFYNRAIKKHFISKAAAWLSTGKTCDQYLLHYGAESGRIYRYSFTSLKEGDILKFLLSPDEKIRLKQELGITEKVAIIAVGQFIHRKGFDVLLKAMPYVRVECGLYIVGGEENEEYRQIVESLKLKNIHFCPFMRKEQLKEYYCSMDLFVLPTREDIWGLVVNEAMSQGLPVITTDRCVAGLELIQNDENGYIVPVDDERALADRINALLNDDDLRKELAEKSLHRIKNYTIENMAKEHMEILNKMQ